ncbi:MAG: winged helix-turn-helix transcriptional regulator [Candidatus Omnitrophica bacterium]|nr:winged helix-turn-helix transcriptional regulator [Candidatus Omnitrophota bacterium]MDE2221454.1 winged helix-turn-helix transcriptional regulator [Candidatus Omnitrophota bacterium]
MDYEKSAAFLKALGHPARLKMAEGIAQYGCHVSKIVDKMGLPQSTVSQHLAALRSAGVVTFEKKGVRACYRLADERVLKIIRILGEMG